MVRITIAWHAQYAAPGPLGAFQVCLPGRGRKVSLIVFSIKDPAQGQLFVIVHAENGVSFLLRLAQGRQQHARQYSDNGDDYKEFNKCECPAAKA